MPELTQEHRRAVCFREAGRAIIHALGGAHVYRVAVAPTGSTSWHYQPRKGREEVDLFGVCEASDAPSVTMHVQWDDEAEQFIGDREGFERLVEQARSVELKGQPPKSPGENLEEWRRLVRACACSRLAGSVAAYVYTQRAFEMEVARADAEFEHDLAVADGISQLLPPGTLGHLVRVTVEALRTPAIWAQVTTLAEELERAGDMADQLSDYLPEPQAGWPTGPVAAQSE
ncbi:hypothetical protein [Paraburkholderia hospita]|uniref:Uncharacterized protein n=1 Tax=Paraburkholderia hospita TaxID=169430 RepID=A0AAN1J4P9_9BURK|nr:hypothetical protein [Paraburkholderia hospita]AUT67020.1 hypothetical protein C2L64_00685 [Paraburkholderia hospita]SEH40850.1 hypothetical protein SAMN05192544_1001279 [Paraburkholderia hospita]